MYLTKSCVIVGLLLAALVCWMVAVPLVVQAAEVYKHVDAQGRITYSDHPVSRDAQKVEIRVPEANAEEAARIGKEQALLAEDDKRRGAQKTAAQRVAAKQAAEENARIQRCTAARGRYLNLTEHSRVYRLDDQGNKVYYSSADLDANRAQAKAAMDSACSN